MLGSNLGDRLKNLESATTLIGERCGKVTARSQVYHTAAWGKTDQPDFLNQAIEIQASSLLPQTLLVKILEIEQELGRERLEKWGTRVIDIDILLFQHQVIRSRDLVIPHAQLENRRFALTPLNEIASQVVHPVLGKKISELLEQCPDQLAVEVFSQD